MARTRPPILHSYQIEIHPLGESSRENDTLGNENFRPESVFGTFIETNDDPDYLSKPGHLGKLATWILMDIFIGL